MLRFLALRIAQFPLILAVIYLVTFLLVWVAPGSPFDRTERVVDPRVTELRKRQLHAEHWNTFLAHYSRQVLLHGDFGPSLAQAQFSVNEILARALPTSAALGCLAMLIATVGGLGIGVISAVRRGGAMDWIGLSVALVGISLPSFVVAAVLLMTFAVFWHWFPPNGWGTWRHMVLPSVALSLMPMAYISRLMRVSMLEILSSDYVRTARAKGLSRPAVVWKHCFRNAFLPVLSYLGPATAMTLTGSFVVEHVFNIAGMGREFVASVQNRDQTLVLGVVVVYSVLLLGLNLLVDVLYTLVDPRIELTAKAHGA